jgi:hypothetical protein
MGTNVSLVNGSGVDLTIQTSVSPALNSGDWKVLLSLISTLCSKP